MEQITGDVNLQSWVMILAGDIGGTKTLIGLFHPADSRPTPAEVRTFATLDYPGLPAIVRAFLDSQAYGRPVQAAAFGVAGPVIGQTAQMTNVPWRVDADQLADGFGFPAVRLLNDLEAMAHAVPYLHGEELATLQDGERRRDGNIGVIAAGTGLGASVLHRVRDGYEVMASEMGHTDFAARSAREVEFASFARARFGRVEIEHLLCGPGLVNLSDYTHGSSQCRAHAHGSDGPDVPAAISQAAMAGTCECCAAALAMFVEAYGATAGNLALTAVTTGGIFIGGGIAPRILSALQQPAFVTAFNDKGPMRSLLEGMPVHVILNASAGLVGAAVYANRMAQR